MQNGVELAKPIIPSWRLTRPWLRAVRGRRVVPLGVDRFGQSGEIPDLYREYGLDADAILDACAQALLG